MRLSEVDPATEEVVNDCAKQLNMAIVEMNGLASDASDLISDGYHTFGELYDHRTKLFAALVNSLPSILTWKSKLHADGTMYDGMFIAGIDTGYGQATYHCEMGYWDLFHCKEIDNAPTWDGHTPADAIGRIVAMFNVM